MKENLTAGLTSAGDSLVAMMTLQADIVTEYGFGEGIRINKKTSVNSQTLEISLVNSDIFPPEDEEIEPKVERLAEFVAKNFEEIEEIDVIKILLVRSKDVGGVVKVSQTESFVYKVDELINDSDGSN